MASPSAHSSIPSQQLLPEHGDDDEEGCEHLAEVECHEEGAGGNTVPGNINTLEVHSCEVTAISLAYNCGGFYGIGIFNVYGGSVDGENNGDDGGYGICCSMNIYGGEVKAVGKESNEVYGYGIASGYEYLSVIVYGGKLWAENADNKAFDNNFITLTKGAGFTGKIETSDDGESWNEYTASGTPETKYVRVGY